MTTLSGKAALRAAVPGCLTLQDISREGRMLVTRDTLRSEMVGLAPGETKERDMTWLDWTLGAAIAADGRTILFSETGEGGGAGYSVYIRKTDGSPAVRLGEGGARDLSLDGEWALAIQRTSSDPRLVAYPTRAGEMKVFKTDGLRVFGAGWLPDGKSVLIEAAEPGRGSRVFRLDVAGGKPRALTPEGYSLAGVTSPDGKWTVVSGPGSPALPLSARGRRAGSHTGARRRRLGRPAQRRRPLSLRSPRRRGAGEGLPPGARDREEGALADADAGRRRRRLEHQPGTGGRRPVLRVRLLPAAVGPLPRRRRQVIRG